VWRGKLKEKEKKIKGNEVWEGENVPKWCKAEISRGAIQTGGKIKRLNNVPYGQ